MEVLENIEVEKYESYVDSGIDWLGSFPTDWKTLAAKYVFKFKKNQVGRKSNEYELLSLTLQGVIKRDMENPQGKFPAEFDTYQEVTKGDFIFCLFDVEETPRTVGLSEFNGMITGAYTVMEVSSEFNRNFIYYFFFNLDSKKRMKPLYKGLRNTIPKDVFGSFKIFVPPLPEQNQIASFLDQKTTQIDQAISKKKRLIELLEERRQIMIHKSVTQGIDHNVKMKDSGVEWIGEIPEHWNVLRSKFIFDEIDDRSETGIEELLSVSHMTGVTPRSEKNVSMFMAEDYSGSKLCTKGDLVINIMWAWMGALGVSDRVGIVSPSYGVFRQKKKLMSSWYLEQLLGDTDYVAEYNRRSTGLHSSRLRLYADYFFDMSLGFPSLEEQRKIEKHVTNQTDKIDQAITSTEQEIEKLKEYKTTLINSTVTGKIKIQ